MAICFYHNADLDGHCSGAIARSYARAIHSENNILMYGINYGDEFPWDMVKDEHVIMLDFSLQPFEDMIKLNDSAKEFIWIDHHISAIKDHAKYNIDIHGIRDTQKAACELAWEYFYPTKVAPMVVYLLGRYDVWDHSDNRTLPFQYGMRLYDTNPSGKFNWDEILNCFPYNILGEGETILKYVKQNNKKYVDGGSFETMLNDRINDLYYRCIAVNKLFGNSQIFDLVWDEEKYDIMVCFGWRNGSWTVSMYTTKDDIDVSIIAKSLAMEYGDGGGGGHKKAAGCQVNSIDFLITKKAKLKELEVE